MSLSHGSGAVAAPIGCRKPCERCLCLLARTSHQSHPSGIGVRKPHVVLRMGLEPRIAQLSYRTVCRDGQGNELAHGAEFADFGMGNKIFGG
jgi:hypothetical protein